MDINGKDVEPFNSSLEKILELFTGDDNTAGAVMVRSANGTYKGSIVN